MKKIFVVMAMAVLLCMPNMACSSKSKDYASIEKQQTKPVEKGICTNFIDYDVLKPGQKILATDSAEVAFQKLEVIMKELGEHEAFEMAVYAYPEKEWYKLIKMVEKANKYIMTPIKYAGDSEYYVWFENK